MIHEISAMDFRQNLGGILNLVNLKHESVIIRRSDEPIAVLIDIDTFHQKVLGGVSSQSLRDFSNGVNAKLGKYKFNRDDANAR